MMWRSFTINTALIITVVIFLLWKNGVQNIELKNAINALLLIPLFGFAITMKYKIKNDARAKRRAHKEETDSNI